MMERFVSALTLTLLLTSLAALAQVQPEQQNPIDRVLQAGLMTPLPDGEFKPDEALSRAELASIVVKVFRLDQRPSDQPLSQSHLESPTTHTSDHPSPSPSTPIALQDVPPSHWAYQDIQTVLRHHVMAGYRQGRFYPDQRVTRAEAFAIFAQAHGVFQFPEQTIDQVLASYPDAREIPSWARKSMATALYGGYVNLRDNNHIDPLSPMTRGDMAQALNLYLQQQNTPTSLPWPMRSLPRLQVFTGTSAPTQEDCWFL